MAFTYKAVGLALTEQRHQALAGCLDPVRQGIEQGCWCLFLQVLADLCEIFPHGMTDGGRFAIPAVARGDFNPLVEIGHQACHRIDVRRLKPSLLQQDVELLIGRKLFHLHGVFNRRTAAAQHRLLLATGNGNHCQVIVGGQPTIQTQLLFTVVATPFQRGKIQKAEINRFLDLVGILSGQDHPGDVGFDQPYIMNRMAVDGRIQQSGNQRGRRCRDSDVPVIESD